MFRVQVSALLAGLAVVGSAQTTSAELLFMDNFDVSDGAFDGAPIAGRLSGTLAGVTALESHGAVQAISNDSLGLIGVGGVRFGPELDRFDWAAGAHGAQIVADGGLVISYDWMPTNQSTDWHALVLGTPNNDIGTAGIVNAATNYGVLLRNSPDVADNFSQSFSAGALISETPSTTFTPTLNTVYGVVHTISLDSFADSTVANVVTTIDGTLIADNDFTLDDGGTFRWEISASGATSEIDNLAVNTVPEPGSLALLGLGGLLVTRRWNG